MIAESLEDEQGSVFSIRTLRVVVFLPSVEILVGEATPRRLDMAPQMSHARLDVM